MNRYSGARRWRSHAALRRQAEEDLAGGYEMIGRPWLRCVPAWMSRRRRSNWFSLKIAVAPAAL
jgi:hypothetical protein